MTKPKPIHIFMVQFVDADGHPQTVQVATYDTRGNVRRDYRRRVQREGGTWRSITEEDSERF